MNRKGLLRLNYTRKYSFTRIIQADISFEMANFIQGRFSSNMGFIYYLAKKNRK